MSQSSGGLGLFCSCGAHRASRRGFLSAGLAGVATMAAGGLLSPRQAWAQTAMSPDAAMQALLEGNKRFVQKQLKSCNDDLSALRKNTVAKQEPFAAVLSCADSRVPVEMVFDEGIGQLFVTRVAGNLATSEIIASLEYGAEV